MTPTPDQEQATQQNSRAPKKRQWFNKIDLRLKLIILFTLFAVIPVFAILYFSIVSVQSSLSEIVGRTLLFAATDTASDVEEFIRDNVNAVQLDAQLPVIVDYLQLPNNQRAYGRADLVATLERLRFRDTDNILSYAMLDENGRNVVDTVTSQIGRDESENEYFSLPVEQGIQYVSPVLFDPDTDQPIIYFSSPIRTNEGVIGVLRMAYNPAALQQLIEQKNHMAGNRSFAIVLDENSMVLAYGINSSRNYKLIGAIDPDRLAELQAAHRLPSGLTASLFTNLSGLEESLRNVDDTSEAIITGQFTPDDEESVGAVKWLEAPLTPRWTVVFSQPQEILLIPVLRQNFEAAFIVFVVIIAAVFAAFNIAKRLTSPLYELIGITRQVAAGALGLDVPVASQYEAGQLATHFRNLVDQLRDLRDSMDRRIVARTKTLETVVGSLESSTRIGRQITTILNIDELLSTVTSQIQAEFKLNYCTQIFLVEEETGDVVLARAAGMVADQLMAQGLRLAVGEGIIGAVAASNEYFLSNDVSRTPQFVAHPLLPETRSELALPLRKGDQVLGVLDIQSRYVDRFSPTDIPLLQSIANQTAIAIENARLLAATRAALGEVERLNRRLTREGWESIAQEVPVQGYRFSNGNNSAITTDSDYWLPPMQQAASHKQLIKQLHPGNGQPAEAELAVPLVLRGEVIGVLGIRRQEAKDWAEEEVSAVEAVADQITRALENARLAKEQEKTIIQLQEVDRLKSEFLTSMSHELRTPLNSIIGFADVIIQGIDGDISDLAMNDVKLIYNSGQHLLALINDILDINKIEAGMMELVRESLDVKEAINDVLAASTSLIKDKPVEIVIDIDDNLPEVYADKLRLNQILLNLVSNAVKFTHKGTVTIKAQISDEMPDRMRIGIRDTGIGIAPDKLKAIFDRFRQADSSTTRQYGGSGLGLAISRQLVELHDSELKVTSEEGVGSEFYFTVPLTESVIE